MATHSTILQRLRQLDRFLSEHPVGDRPAIFEKLVCEGFACALHSPCFDQSHDDPSQSCRVIWYGSEMPLQKSPRGPDGLVRAHGFFIVLDCSLKTGTKQWSQEFARCLDHARDTTNTEKASPGEVHVVLAVKTVAEDTFTSIKAHNNGRSPYKLLPMEIGELELLVETADLAFTLRHLDVRAFLQDAIERLRHASDVHDYRTKIRQCAAQWQKSVLDLERKTVFGIRCCEVLVAENRRSVGVSEILSKLVQNRAASLYAEKTGASIDPQEVVDSLKQESLGVVVGKLWNGEELFAPVPLPEFKSRCRRRTNAVEEAHARR